MTTKKVALVTGASRGIGRATALKLAQENIHVVALARTVGALEALDDEIKAAGGTCTLIPQDLLKLNELDNLGPALLDKFGRLDILIANAGMLGTLGPVPHAKPDEFQKVMDVNFTANFRLIRTLDPLLRHAPEGQIVFVVRDVTIAPRAYWGLYTASKDALYSLAKVYAQEVKEFGINVHFFNPGTVDTTMLSDAFPGGYTGEKKLPQEVAQDIFKRLSL